MKLVRKILFFSEEEGQQKWLSEQDNIGLPSYLVFVIVVSLGDKFLS